MLSFMPLIQEASTFQLKMRRKYNDFFLLEGEALVNSQEYAGTILRAGEFILQAIGSKYEILALTDVECVCYRFNQPEFFCEERYKYIMKEITPPLIFTPLKISPELRFFLDASKAYLAKEDLPGTAFVQAKELAFLLGEYYSIMISRYWYILFPVIRPALSILSCKII